MSSRQNFLFSLSNKGSCWIDGLKPIVSDDWQVTLVSVLLRRDSDKAQIQEEMRIFAKGLNQEPGLENDVSGKPLKNEGNEAYTIAQYKWKQYKIYMIVFIGFKKETTTICVLGVGGRRRVEKNISNKYQYWKELCLS